MDINSIDGWTPQLYYTKRFLVTNVAICSLNHHFNPKFGGSQKSPQKSQDPIIVKVQDTWRGASVRWVMEIHHLEKIPSDKPHQGETDGDFIRPTEEIWKRKHHDQRPVPCFCFFPSVEQGCWSVKMESLEKQLPIPNKMMSLVLT